MNTHVKVVYNDEFCPFVLSREAIEWMKARGFKGKFEDRDGICVIPRHHSLLVECVEALGERAGRALTGRPHNVVGLVLPSLKIAEIPGEKYYIVDYDMSERVIGINDMVDTAPKEILRKFDPDGLWFTSDTHFFHNNIIEYCNRPFGSVREMNEELIRRWNETVPQDGTVFHLGDFALGTNRECNDVLYRLNGTIYLILGNHDMKHIGEGFMSRFEHVAQQMTIRVGGQAIVLNHNPFLCYGGSNRDVWQLFGHVHSGPRSRSGLDVPRLKMLYPTQYDVGVDNNDYRPVSFAEVKNIIQKQQGSIKIYR